MINFIYRVLNSDPHLPIEINRLTIELTLGSEEVQMLVQKRNAIANLSSPNNNNQQQLENGGIRPNVSQYSICIQSIFVAGSLAILVLRFSSILFVKAHIF